MNKTVKRLICAILIPAVLCGAVWGGLVLIRNAQKKPVNVYSVSDFATMDDYSSSSQTYGTVTMDHMQKIYLTETQTVKKVYVKEGQKVKKGDKLLSYDTTLTDIDLEKARIELSKLKLQKTTAENELASYKKMKPHSSVLVTPSANITYNTQKTPLLLGGSGTKDDPFYYLWSESDTLDSDLLNQILPGSSSPETPSTPDETKAPEPETETPSQEPEETEKQKTEKPETETPAAAPRAKSSSGESYVVFIVRENNALNGQVTDSWGLHLDKSSGSLEIRFFQPSLPEEMLNYDSVPEPYYQESGSDYTASELAQMKLEKEQEIKDLEVSIKIADLELRQKEKETTDGTVLSTIDGTVKTLRDAGDAFQNSEAVIEVSAGGGYYVDGALSELELGTVHKGQTVQVNSWTTGISCTGEIVEISTYPTTSSSSYSSTGNTNVSYYPFRIFVDESSNLVENDAVDITYQNQGEDGSASGFFLDNSFIRTENGRSFVYARNEDGLLEQRTVQTGRDLYGYYTEIRSGLTMDDYIAFPYGSDVTDGARTNESTPDALYEY